MNLLALEELGPDDYEFLMDLCTIAKAVPRTAEEIGGKGIIEDGVEPLIKQLESVERRVHCPKSECSIWLDPESDLTTDEGTNADDSKFWTAICNFCSHGSEQTDTEQGAIDAFIAEGRTEEY